VLHGYNTVSLQSLSTEYWCIVPSILHSFITLRVVVLVKVVDILLRLCDRLLLPCLGELVASLDLERLTLAPLPSGSQLAPMTV